MVAGTLTVVGGAGARRRLARLTRARRRLLHALVRRLPSTRIVIEAAQPAVVLWGWRGQIALLGQLGWQCCPCRASLDALLRVCAPARVNSLAAACATRAARLAWPGRCGWWRLRLLVALGCSVLDSGSCNGWSMCWLVRDGLVQAAMVLSSTLVLEFAVVEMVQWAGLGVQHSTGLTAYCSTVSAQYFCLLQRCVITAPLLTAAL